MWLRNPLDDVLSSRAKVSILRVLCHVSAPLSGREIARRAGIWSGPGSKALGELTASGIITCQHHGRTNTYSLADVSVPMVRRVRDLFWEEARRPGDFCESLTAEVPELLSVILFGSEARSEARPDSDSDLLLFVGTKSESLDRRISDACLEYSIRHGLHTSWMVVDLTDLREWEETDNEFWRNVRRDGIVLRGMSMSGLSRRSRADGDRG